MYEEVYRSGEKQAVEEAQISPQYCQFPYKNSRDFSKDI